jgi:hypothetical protein
MLIKQPFVYNKDSRGMASQTFSILNDALVSHDYDALSHFPIEYLLTRSDYNDEFKEPKDIQSYAKLVFKNSTFHLYKLNKFSPAVISENAKFAQINPTKYFASFSKFDPSKPITLSRNFDSNWRLFVLPANIAYPDCDSTHYFENFNILECLTPMKFLDSLDVRLMYARELGALHSNVNGFNQWRIDPSELNKLLLSSGYTKNQIDSGQFKLLIYLKSQFYYWALLVVSLTFFVAYLLLLLRARIKSLSS